MCKCTGCSNHHSHSKYASSIEILNKLMDTSSTLTDNQIKTSRTNSLDNHTSDNTSNIGKKAELFD